jgi:hypothetical protein
MATVNKDFRVKHGLVVEGSTATVNGSNVLTEASTEFLQDTTAAMFTNGTQSGITFTYNDTTGVIDASVSTDPVFGDKITFEGTTPDSFETILQVVDPTADRTITLPDISGTVITTGDTGTVTNTMLAGSIANEKLLNSAITINGVSTSLGGSRTLGTDDVAEGATNKYFTDERAQDAVGLLIANGTQTNITVTYDDANAALNFNATGGVSSISGTANEIEVTNVGTAYTVGLPNDITVAGNITINGTPTQSTHAVTKGYVDSVAEGLNVHPASKAATTTNIDLTTGGLLIIDGYQTIAGDRILVKSQTNAAQNGIYVVASGAWTRAADFDAPAEIVPGDFTFVENGSTYADTGWVQTNTVTTVGTDPIAFTQFSGAGTYLAGNGLTLTGGTFSIDTTITADLSTTQTLTNKTLTSPTISGLYLSDNNIVVEGTNDTHETTLTFTDPTQDNTITFKNATGTVAFTSDIETAIDGFGNAVVAGTGISASYNSSTNALTITNTDLGSSQNIFKNVVVGATTISADSNNDTLTLSAGTGITLTPNSTTDTIDIANSGVTSLTGTANQVTVSASTGSVTLSLPQSINTTSSPTFAGVTVGSVTLTDALIGSATASLVDGSATVVDTWSATSYNSAKYIVQMKNGTDIEVIEVLVTVDGNNNVYLTEYADVISNTQLGTTDADYSSGNVRLLVTASNGTTVKVHKTLIEA